MAQGRSTKIISMIKWIRTSKLSIKNSLCSRTHRRGHFCRPTSKLLRMESRSSQREYLEKGFQNSHGARPVHQIISMIKWIRTSRLSIMSSLSEDQGCQGHVQPHQGGRVTKYRSSPLHRSSPPSYLSMRDWTSPTRASP